MAKAALEGRMGASDAFSPVSAATGALAAARVVHGSDEHDAVWWQ